MQLVWNCLVPLILLPYLSSSLDNGLARTPPMGWMTGERFGCNVDCKRYPDDCLSENLIWQSAAALVKLGYKDRGYTYLVLDDCWMERKRDTQGKLRADRSRFPSGMKQLAHYVHSLGLKLGLYLGIGDYTCHGFPGSKGHFRSDAETLASWGVDMVKADGCNVSQVKYYNEAFPALGRELNQTGRQMLYLCVWPAYLRRKGARIDYKIVTETCNQFRTYDNLTDNWEVLEKTIKYYGENGGQLANYTGPGHWNDPDQLLVGDYGLSIEQQKMHMAIWSIMSAPLFISADVRNMRKQSMSFLINKKVIAINQDPLAIMGIEILKRGQVHVWKKPIVPRGSFALALLYNNISGGPTKVSLVLRDIGLHTAAAYNFTEVFDGEHLGIYKPWHTFNCEVNPTGVLFIEALALP